MQPPCARSGQALLGMTAFERHKRLMADYVQFYGGKAPEQAPPAGHAHRPRHPARAVQACSLLASFAFTPPVSKTCLCMSCGSLLSALLLHQVGSADHEACMQRRSKMQARLLQKSGNCVEKTDSSWTFTCLRQVHPDGGG